MVHLGSLTLAFRAVPLLFQREGGQTVASEQRQSLDTCVSLSLSVVSYMIFFGAKVSVFKQEMVTAWEGHNHWRENQSPP